MLNVKNQTVMLKVTIEQKSKGFVFTQEFKNQLGVNRSVIIGTSLKAIIDLVDLRAKVGFKGISLAEPFDLTIEVEGRKVTTVNLDSFLRAKLKIGNTPQSKRRFARIYTALVDFSTTEQVATTVEQVIESIKE